MQSSFVIVYLIASLFGLTSPGTPSVDSPDNSYSSNSFPVHLDGLNTEMIEKAKAEKRMLRFSLGQSQQQRRVEAWFFPGSSDKHALVIGGVHGSELSSVEIARSLIAQLQVTNNSYYNVIIIPSLFPDNADKALSEPAHIGSTHNIGRYSHAQSVDPNRQMPSPGAAFDEETGLDHHGRKIEFENTLLLQLIQSFRPQRILNIHAIRNTGYGGIYADPRTDHQGIALGFASDSGLAISIAENIHLRGGNVSGNKLETAPTALYYKDPVPSGAGQLQKRNTTGSALKDKRGSGISLGTWASTAVVDGSNPSSNRDAIRIITMEYPGCKRPADYNTLGEQLMQYRQIELFAASIQQIFLGSYFIEEETKLIAGK